MTDAALAALAATRALVVRSATLQKAMDGSTLDFVDALEAFGEAMKAADGDAAAWAADGRLAALIQKGAARGVVERDAEAAEDAAREAVDAWHAAHSTPGALKKLRSAWKSAAGAANYGPGAGTFDVPEAALYGARFYFANERCWLGADPDPEVAYTVRVRRVRTPDGRWVYAFLMVKRAAGRRLHEAESRDVLLAAPEDAAFFEVEIQEAMSDDDDASDDEDASDDDDDDENDSESTASSPNRGALPVPHDANADSSHGAA